MSPSGMNSLDPDPTIRTSPRTVIGPVISSAGTRHLTPRPPIEGAVQLTPWAGFERGPVDGARGGRVGVFLGAGGGGFLVDARQLPPPHAPVPSARLGGGV